VDDELLKGLTAYAQEQQDREVDTSESLTAKWVRIRKRGHLYLARETPTAAAAAVVVALDGEGDEELEDEEEGPPDYEDEGDDEILD
jgi:transposase-like protein